MKAGQQLVLIGYPMEQLNSTDITAPNPPSADRHHHLDDVVLPVEHRAGDRPAHPALGARHRRRFGQPMFQHQGQGRRVPEHRQHHPLPDARWRHDAPAFGGPRQLRPARRPLLDLAEGKADAKMPGYIKQMEEADAALTKTPEAFIGTSCSCSAGNGRPEERHAGRREGSGDGHAGAVAQRPPRRGVEVTIEQPGVYVFAGASLDRRIIQTSIYACRPTARSPRSTRASGLTPYSFVVSQAEGPAKIFVVVADGPGRGRQARPEAGKAKIWVIAASPAAAPGG